ncbi:MAG TPA: hypothetical protein VGF38_23240 [Ktedonobacterales bacterium]
MQSFTREAVQVLKYLVFNSTPIDFVPFVHIVKATDLHEAVFSDAIFELEESALVEVHYHNARPHARAWEIVGADVVGFDVCKDASKLAQAVNDAHGDEEHGWIEAQLLEQMVSLPVERLNIAALWLEDDGILELRPMGARPYAFASARATDLTGKWLQTQS